MDCNKRKIGNPKRKKSEVDYCLPDDVFFTILLCLPADVLYNVMRLVCKQWFNIIQSPLFISSHLNLKKDSTSKGLLIRHKGITAYVVKLWSDQGGRGRVLEVKDLNIPFGKRVCASCNGLLLLVGRTSKCPTIVVNPLTKQYLALPLFPKDYLDRYNCCLAYAATSRVYKVIHYPSCQLRCSILSVGVDKEWRDVDLSHLSQNAKLVMSIACSSLTLRGCVYWYFQFFPIILCFDIETETFREIPLPFEYKLGTRSSGLIAMESSVCMWSRNNYLCEFWLLKDSETGDEQWEKMLDFNVKDQKHLPIYIKPLGWLRSRDLLVFCTKTQIMVYNVNTGKVHQTKEMKNHSKEMKKLTEVMKNHGDMEDHRQFYAECYADSLVPLNNLSSIMNPKEEVYLT